MPGLGRNFGKLWAATTITNIGDGVAAAATPLLVASLTDDPVLVGLAVFAGQLPWLLFSLLSGVYVDRLDRQRLIVLVNLVRGLVIGLLTLAVATGNVSLAVIYAAAFLLGTCETVGDNAAATMVPAVVRSEDLPRANSRLQAAFFVVNQFAGPPLGAFLFVLAVPLPFGVNAATFGLAALIMATLRGVARARARPDPSQDSGRDSGPDAEPDDEPDAEPEARWSVRTDIADGVRWLWRMPVIRMLALALCLMNVTLMAGFSLLVLYARERLGLGEFGFGVLMTGTAIGGVLGALIAPWLQARFAGSVLLRVGLVIETLTHVGLALAPTVWIAGPVLVAFGAHAALWGAVAVTIRQRAVPDELRGRVQSVYMMFSVGGAAFGALIGGPIARAFGIAGPFWMSAIVMGVLTVVAWRAFGRRLVRQAETAATADVPVSR